MKKLFTLLAAICVFVGLKAQNGGISGKVLDESGEGVPVANVVLVDAKGQSTGRGVTTDFDGNYSIKPLTPGKYNVQVSYVGYATQIMQGIIVNADAEKFINFNLKPSSTELAAVEIVSYKVPLIDPSRTSSSNTVTSEEIANMPTKSVTDIAATTAGAFQSDQGKGINIKGQRDAGTQYYIDGVKVTGVPTVPASSIEQLQVITGGIPAKYGDVTGGIVNITSKGPSAQFNGGVEVQTSQGLDAYGYNLVNANLTGPIVKKNKRTIMGFFLAFEYLRQQDPNPSAVGVWQVRPEVLDELRQNPLVKKPTATGFNLASEDITYKDMYKVKVKPNTVDQNFRGTGRLDIRPADNITLSFGGSATYRKYNDWVEKYTLYNSENNPLNTQLNWRVFGRFTHNIGGRQNEDEEKDGKKKKSSAFQNAFYSLQVDYEKYQTKYEDESHGANYFNYGYIGKFETLKSPIFGYDTFAVGNQVLTGWKQLGFTDTAVAFTPGNLNQYGTRFTQQYYELLGATPDANGRYEAFGDNNANFTSTLDQIQANQALINGTRSNIVYNIWYNTGRQYNGYGKDNDNDQYRVRLEGAFDILKPGAPSRNKHSFEFGVEFEQRIQRSYTVSPLGLWQRARSLANLHLTELDRSNPTLRINGQDYAYNDPTRPAFYLTDTILFSRLYNAEKQTFFDKSLRQSLGMATNNTDFIDVDALSPSQLNLNMFSPENLLGDGSNLVSYRGYDPYGNRLTKQPSFNDFFTKKRADGELERAIPAYSPIYTAAYISDRFYFKDLTFNVGVRFDRFDANQKVLKDEFSLYPINNAAEAKAIGFGTGPISLPSNIGDDYYVYVDNSKAPTAIAGYRHNNVWYDRFGNELTSGKAVASASSTGTIQPFLKDPNSDIKDPDKFDPNGTFEDYKPKLVVMPRLQFSFNLTDRALFFAHYDILAQRPNNRVIMNPLDYLFFTDNIGGALNNPNLKPERTVDFELGFKQKVSNTSAFTISAFYREFRDQIQIRKIINAYPKDYITYGNIDFGTTKGFTLDFDLRRTANFSLKANYTMQFAEGTGSDDQSQLNLVNSNQPNFRSINSLNYDARHMINVNATYSFGDGKDYNGPITKKGRQPLSNSGITLQLMARSGTPYTAQVNATPEALEGQPGRPITKGSVNGSRIPWYFRLNFRVWKDFTFVVGKKDAKREDKRELALQIYLQIQNLIGSKNSVTVYRFTGTPSDDGYLGDPASLSAVQAALNPQAYKDQYAAYINRPDNYSLPRRIFLGAIFSF
jgi:outer membrane receptor protein involved in Fe transport